MITSYCIWINFSFSPLLFVSLPRIHPETEISSVSPHRPASLQPCSILVSPTNKPMWLFCSRKRAARIRFRHNTVGRRANPSVPPGLASQGSAWLVHCQHRARWRPAEKPKQTPECKVKTWHVTSRHVTSHFDREGRSSSKVWCSPVPQTKILTRWRRISPRLNRLACVFRALAHLSRQITHLCLNFARSRRHNRILSLIFSLSNILISGYLKASMTHSRDIFFFRLITKLLRFWKIPKAQQHWSDCAQASMHSKLKRC